MDGAGKTVAAYIKAIAEPHTRAGREEICTREGPA